MTKIIDRIEREIGMPGLASLLAERLEPSDLQSLLLDVYRHLARRRLPATVLDDYATNRFVHPSRVPVTALAEWDRVAFSCLPAGFDALELSPVCPLGTSSVVAGLAQDRALTTIRNTEVVSDSTNVLALEAAVRRRELKRADARSTTIVHLAASHRLLRTQHYANPQWSSHFRVFSLCSAGRDSGAFRFETEGLALHVECYVAAIRAYLGADFPLRVLLTILDDGASTAGEQLVERVGGIVDVAMAPTRTAGREYYRTMCFWIYGAVDTPDPIQLVDGGCVDWAQRLLSDGKERLVISGIGSDRVCTARRRVER